MHGGSMQSCPAMHSCPPWETTHPKFVPPFKCIRWVGSMPLGLFTMCLAWVSTCSLCFERGDSCTWGFHAQVSAHAWLSPTRHYTLEVCCTIQMDLYAQIVCPKGCLPYGYHTLTHIYWVSIVGTAMHGGSMQSSPAMHSCPPWETTHPKFVPSFKCT